jgi:hypothetical protein
MDIAMHDADRVRFCECGQHAGRDNERLLEVELTASQSVAQALAVESLHDEVRLTRLGGPCVVAGDDGVVSEPLYRRQVSLESAAVFRGRRSESLHRDPLAGLPVASPEGGAGRICRDRCLEGIATAEHY